jgi:hypothetical protein
MVNKPMWNWLDEVEGKKKGTSLKNLEKEIERQREKALKRNVKRRKGKFATAKDQELMFGY